ncbi:MAG: phosphoribosylanthranilate isomerase [Gammaproteobacteria bacterium]|nr:phosphoribosylanthranilate isomerase [Gammaproteobacteria bacterium]
MKRTRVKVCGITRIEDAMAAVEAGADAIGLVFYEPSPRFVRIEQAKAIAASVPAFVSVVALFVNAEPEYVQEVLNNVRIDLLQFHGDEENDFCGQFQRPFIKAQRVRQASDVVASSLRFPDALGILLDSYKPGVPGGTGETFDWSLIPESKTKPLILAGGLTPDNVASAIEQVQPFAVDVSGGVEQSKGIKDPVKIDAFLSEVYGVNR